MNKFFYLSLSLLLGVLLPSSVAWAQCATNTPSVPEAVTPNFVTGNPALCPGGKKIDPPVSGTYDLDNYGNRVTITVSNDPDCGQVFAWTISSTLGTPNIVIERVVAKGGPNANVYDYQAAGKKPTTDGKLHSPLTSSGKYADLSHIDFCFRYVLTVGKTAQTSYSRTHNWEIDKQVSPANWALFNGESGTSRYTVAVDKTGFTDGNWAVSGTITIANNTPNAATIQSVSDMVSGYGAVLANCGVVFPYILPAGATLSCSYTTALPDGTNRTNTVTVVTTGVVDGGTATAPVTFGAPTTEVNKSINVTDTNGQAWGPVSDDTSWSYEVTFSCAADAGTHPNVASIVETGQSDDAEVTVVCYELSVSKNATTTFNRYWDWLIEKTCTPSSPNDPLVLSPGQTYTVNYKVNLSASATDDDYRVDGTITIANPHPTREAILTAVTDLVSPNIAATVSCPSLIVPAGGTLQCSYTAELPDGTNRTNTATATQRNYAFAADGTATEAGTTDYSGSAAVVFGTTPSDEIDECVDVDDSLKGSLGTYCASAGPAVIQYSQPVSFQSPTGCGPQTVTNVASFTTQESGATGSDDCNVYFLVNCQTGCTLTPGYWKTHSKYGPAPYDDTWALLPQGANTPFFLSGQTYYQVLWTPPAGGNVYYILAHAYIAATLNVLNGASAPADVVAALNAAKNFFNTYTPASAATLKGKARTEFINIASKLDAYNNGLIGPGHCDDDGAVSSSSVVPVTGSNAAIAPEGTVTTKAYQLEPNRPNPFQGTTTIAFSLPEAAPVQLNIYDLTGRQVATLANSYFPAGTHQLDWVVPADTPAGIYFYRLETGSVVLTQRMQLVR